MGLRDMNQFRFCGEKDQTPGYLAMKYFVQVMQTMEVYLVKGYTDIGLC